MSSIFSRFLINHNKPALVRVRFASTHGENHWSVVRRRVTSCDRALKHFDEFYESVYGRKWEGIRKALLSNNHKYVAIVNNYSDTERTREELTCLGAMNLKDVYKVYKELYATRRRERENKIEKAKNLQQYMADRQLLAAQSLYPDNYDKPLATQLLSQKNTVNKNDDEDDDITERKKKEMFTPHEMQSIEKDVTYSNANNNRIIKPVQGLASFLLYEYVPATEIKGKDDFILESDHYGFYNKAEDFSTQTEDEEDITIPENLHIYAFEKHSKTKFPKPKKGSTGVDDYYVLDGGSILPVLALDMQRGDVVLDMCSSPGGKAVTILQTLLPKIIVLNEIQNNRVKKINEFFADIFIDSEAFKNTYFITNEDASFIEDKNIYDKILVDVPCTTDRHALNEDDNNIFKTTRIQERLRLPELQSSILTNALTIVKLGGTVVYSTCTLSPVQNDGVVQNSLKQAFEQANHRFIVKDQTKALAPLGELFRFGNFGLKYGHIVTPTISNNWGPLYFCKMVRVQ